MSFRTDDKRGFLAKGNQGGPMGSPLPRDGQLSTVSPGANRPLPWSEGARSTDRCGCRVDAAVLVGTRELTGRLDECGRPEAAEEGCGAGEQGLRPVRRGARLPAPQVVVDRSPRDVEPTVVEVGRRAVGRGSRDRR